MGGNISKSEQKVLMDTSTSIVNNVLTNFKTTQTNNQVGIQEVDINANVLKCGGDFSISQTQNNTISALMNATNTDTTDLTNKIYNQLDADVKNSIAQKNDGLNFLQANANWSSSDVEQRVRSAIHTAITTNIENSLKNNSSNIQIIPMEVRLFDITGNCRWNQDQQIQLLSQMIANTAASLVMTNFVPTELGVTATNTVDQSNAGIFAFGGIFGLIGVVLIGYIIYMVVKKKSGGGGGGGEVMSE